jgi:hypothetical protein
MAMLHRNNFLEALAMNTYAVPHCWGIDPGLT